MDRSLKKALECIFDELEKMKLDEDKDESERLQDFDIFLDSLWTIKKEWKRGQTSEIQENTELLEVVVDKARLH